MYIHHSKLFIEVLPYADDSLSSFGVNIESRKRDSVVIEHYSTGLVDEYMKQSIE